MIRTAGSSIIAAMLPQVTIMGDGAMGTVCAMLLAANGARVRLWGRDASHVRQIARQRENKRYLPGYRLADSIEAGCDASWAFAGSEMIISAVPSQYIRSTWQSVAPSLSVGAPVISVAKGIENDTLLRPTQILAELCGARNYAVLSGPSIAHEIADGLPCSVVAACGDGSVAKRVQQMFNSPTFRVYTNDDVVGVELAGAMKNVVAIAAGILDGLKLGDNAKAALLSRGLAEITRLGIAMGARAETFYGLAGVGDLITTCISPYGRNRTAGQHIGEGKSAEHVVRTTASVIEGIATARSVIALSRKHKVDMPITQAVGAVLFENVPPAQAVQNLMTRELKAE